MIKRLKFDLFLLLGMMGLAFFFSDFVANSGLLSLWITKAICITTGIFHAHISRKMLFPYIDFKTETRWDNNAMIIVWYTMIIFAWARGG